VTRTLTDAQAAVLAAGLELDLDDGICHACLSFVSSALEDGEPREIARELRRVTVDLCLDGLDRQALRSVEQACGLGLPNADEALADLRQRGGKSHVARAIVRRLAEELSVRTRTELRVEALARSRIPLAAAEMN
jgi:hypothetical protein